MAVVAPTSRTLHSFPISHLPFRLSEADLSRLWQDQTFPPEALTTTDGQRLRVVYRGRRTGGPGPDFRDALIAAPGGLLRGDVELHVRSSDFRHHGHHMDPAYARIVLHLVFRADEPAATLLPGGGRAQVVALAGWVEGRAQEISRWLERPALWREPCLSALARSGAPAVGATLDRLGDIRFRAMTAAFARRLAAEKPEQVLWRALIEALGYGGDHELFRAIADRLPWAPTREDLLALPAAARAPEAYRRLAGAASGLPVAPARPMRPANRPETRLKGAAALAARFAAKGLVDAFVAALDGDGLVSPSEVTETEKEKLEDRKREGTPSRLRVSNFEFRSAQPSHLGSQMIALVAVPRLVGRSRAVELLANAILPFVAALGPEGRARRAETVYQRLPLPARYGAVRHLHGAAEGVPVDFRRQQGMLYLFKQYCTQGGCGRCPLS